MVRAFRAAVFLDLLCLVIIQLLPSSIWEAESYADLLRFDGYSARLLLVHSIYDWLPLLLFSVALIGLAFLQNWGRFLFLLLWLLSALGVLVFGVRVVPPLLGFLELLESTLDGIILAIVFFSPLRHTFARGKVTQGPVSAA